MSNIVILYMFYVVCMFYCIYVCFSTLSKLNKVNILFDYLRLPNYINLFSDSKIKHNRGFTWIRLYHLYGVRSGLCCWWSSLFLRHLVFYGLLLLFTGELCRDLFFGFTVSHWFEELRSIPDILQCNVGSRIRNRQYAERKRKTTGKLLWEAGEISSSVVCTTV